MKIAVLIPRDAQYKVFGPVIDAALARGWEVECWHDYSQLRDGPKGYQFPSIESVPAFRNGTPSVKTYHGTRELTAWLAEMRADAVLSSGVYRFEEELPARRPLLVCQQYFIDSLTWPGPDGVLAWDLLALYSRWWLDWSARHFAAEGLITRPEEYLRDAASRTAFVGLPEMDAAALIDPAAVRARWVIPAGQPVVVLFPFPQGVGRNTFWPKRICGEASRLKQLASIAAYRRFEYLPHVRHGWNDRNVVRAIRDFCDRNGAYLLVKSREKTPIPAYTQSLADLCIYDEGFYPATVLEALSIASLSISYYSNSVFESVALGVPHLCVTFTAEDYNGAPSNYFSQFYTAEEGSAFQFRGVATAWSLPETLDRLPGKGFRDFAIDPASRACYIERFLSHDARDGGARTVDAIEQALTRNARAAEGARA